MTTTDYTSWTDKEIDSESMAQINAMEEAEDELAGELNAILGNDHDSDGYIDADDLVDGVAGSVEGMVGRLASYLRWDYGEHSMTSTQAANLITKAVAIAKEYRDWHDGVYAESERRRAIEMEKAGI